MLVLELLQVKLSLTNFVLNCLKSHRGVGLHGNTRLSHPERSDGIAQPSSDLYSCAEFNVSANAGWFCEDNTPQLNISFEVGSLKLSGFDVTERPPGSVAYFHSTATFANPELSWSIDNTSSHPPPNAGAETSKKEETWGGGPENSMPPKEFEKNQETARISTGIPHEIRKEHSRSP
eukprot:jgi/Botrbrau1/6481/Bobra.0034s0054.1